MQKLVNDFNIKHHFTFVEHPQTNGQVEAANRVILKGLERRLDDTKGNWADELHHVIWAWRNTFQTHLRYVGSSRRHTPSNKGQLTIYQKRARFPGRNKKLRLPHRSSLLRRPDIGEKDARDGKLVCNWEGPY
ncbi:gypsy retrotransposon integrase-like protein, partial [Trifolium medium]|nr:gypsy retrotransposon integrase-like protein [Trifolium medium]